MPLRARRCGTRERAVCAGRYELGLRLGSPAGCSSFACIKPRSIGRSLADRLGRARPDGLDETLADRDFLREFRDLWHRCTAPSDIRKGAEVARTHRDESIAAIEDLVSLANKGRRHRHDFPRNDSQHSQTSAGAYDRAADARGIPLFVRRCPRRSGALETLRYQPIHQALHIVWDGDGK